MPGVQRLSFTRPCRGTVITMWPEERGSWVAKTLTEKTRPWHPAAYVVMHPPRGFDRLFHLLTPAARWMICSVFNQYIQEYTHGRSWIDR